MAIWSSTGQDKSLVEKEKEPTELEILESIKAGDWLQFCPCVYDNDTDYVKVVAVKHTAEMVSFDFIYISSVANCAPATFELERVYINEDGKIGDMVIRTVDHQELIDYVSRQIDNLGDILGNSCVSKGVNNDK